MARYALNLPVQLKEEAARVAKEQGVSLNQFILWSVSEKVGALRQSLDDPDFPHVTYRRGAGGTPTPVLRGRGMRVQAIVGYVNGWGMSLEEVADSFDLPVSVVAEAMSFYEAHRLEIDAAIEADRRFAIEAGYGS
jgi:uncharacterized protein (DUF433 family)